MRALRRLALAGVLLGFVVVVLGAYVRLTAAGLGCPDWPGCYGHVTPPDAALDVGKAWREMIHRYAASSLGLIIVVLAAIGIVRRRERLVPPGLVVGLLAVVVFQGLLGMLTVTLQLKPLIVTAHLLFGLTTLALLWWLWLTLRARAAAGRAQPAPHDAGLGPARRLAILGLAALVLQIALGGWTSSNYAAVACPDLPTCQNQWLPPMSYRDAFVLWHGIGINYEGGILSGPARVAIHFTHRIGAIVATVALLLAAAVTLRRTGAGAGSGARAGAARSAPARRAALAVIAALGLQLGIGTFMVLRGFPLPLATAHNAGAALLVLAVVALNRTLRPLAGASAGVPAGNRSRFDSATLRIPSTAPLAEPPAQP